jgi:hypothetical protein
MNRGFFLLLACMKLSLKLLTVLLFALTMQQTAWSQRRVGDSIIGTPWIALHYGGNWTGANLADRYGFFNHLGAMAGYKTKRNWVYGLDGNFMFGSKIRMTGLFDHLADSKGIIHDVNGDVGTVVLFSRGFNVNLMVGKVFPVWSPNNNSGIYVHGGVGYLQHKLRIETNDQVIPSLELDYKKGYDRFSSGINFHEFVGYAFLANQGIVNFYGGFYFQQGMTYNRRDIFFDQPDREVPKGMMLDLQFGFKVGWFVPVYQRKPKDFYFD